tara:strand:+ start:200 stop:3001 length:2802 start_codon:yes stop_codon:yes gene_type:complete
MTQETPLQVDTTTLLDRIALRAFVQTTAMIHLANSRKDKRPGDPKVGGHPASCASSLHFMTALHLAVREPQDFVCCKPHAAPLDHSLHHLVGMFRHGRDGAWFTDEEAEGVMERLRKFPQPGAEDVFQSYHAEADPDSFHFLPSGSVGIPPVASVYLALAYRYAADHGWEVPENAHFWSMMGDSEFREGSLLEAMPDVAERQLGNVTWIVDYNRQNLDGTRIPNERGLEGADCDRIERTAVANGWRVIQLRHGPARIEAFAGEHGAALKAILEKGLSDYEYQVLALKGDAASARQMISEKSADAGKALAAMPDEQVLKVLLDLGGHDMGSIIAALKKSRTEPDVPYLLVIHTLKGWGLPCQADPSNHSWLPKKKEMIELLEANGLTLERPFERFAADSDEGRFLEARKDTFRAGWDAHNELRDRNLARVASEVEAVGGLPESLDIDMSLFPMANTQWMWGQLATKLVRIGTHGDDPKAADLGAGEERWVPAAKLVLTMSPDVGTSTNISPAIDQRVYGPAVNLGEVEDTFGVTYKHPELHTTQDPWTRHIRFEIAEANAMSALGSFGKMGYTIGVPLAPVMTVYDFFIKRALDQLYYDLYWGAEFVLMGTPAGVTLSAEGAQHSWKSDIQIPNLITWEPMFAVEMDWILTDALRRQVARDNVGRKGVLIRAVTRGVPQAHLLDNVRRQAASKASQVGALKPAGTGDDWGQATDESTVAPLPDEVLLAQLKQHSLAGGYKLIDWTGYEGFEPGDNVVNVFAMGSLATEAIAASEMLLDRGVFANVIIVSSPELLLGILGEQSDYTHLRETLGINGDLYAVQGAGSSEAGMVSLAGRRVPCVAVCDGEAGLLDNIGSIVGVKQRTLAVRRFSKCGRPDEVFGYQGLDADAIVQACGRSLAETALEDLVVPRDLLERLANRQPPTVRDWRALWPDA